MRVGIPRALFYYHYYPLWRAFLETLDVEVVVSPPTHQSILAGGVNRITGEACLPSKIYCGHVLALVDRVDYILAPLIRRLTPTESNCPRFLGLPDVVRAAVPGAPPMLAPEIDLRKGLRGLMAAVVDLGRRFTLDPRRLKRAVDCGQAAHAQYCALLRRGWTAPEAIHCLDAAEDLDAVPDRRRDGVRVALLGHPYNLYDAYANHDLVRRLRTLGLDLVTSDMVTAGLPDGRSPEDVRAAPYWTYEAEFVEAGEGCLDQVSGVIAVAAFACGPDAVLLESVEKLCRRRARPFLKLILDEHTGEAGLVTRIEAFVDMLDRRQRLGRPQTGPRGGQAVG
jgi:predicted nucleotide-binding protein (sugar kinase/HSP70/actin superfamily)